MMKLTNTFVDLKMTLTESGQCFRWVEHAGAFGAVFEGKAVWLTQTEEGIFLDGGDGDFFRHYLDLDRDYRAIAKEYESFPAAKQAIEALPGLRRLNQPAWETLISFILSANNNVARIEALVKALSRALGQKVLSRGATLYGFPAPEALAEADEGFLRSLGVGYRAPYLKKTAQAVVDGFPINSLCTMDYDSAHVLLTGLAGVGDKVADCVQLLGCGHTCAFPVDVWVERLMQNWFSVTAKNRTALAKEARRCFGENGGILQMFLFHAARTGAIGDVSKG